MVFEHIENLKNTYTDKNVLVDVDRPELGRFQGLTGTVKTVNMSGRALVEFDGHKNIGWFDIDVDFLKLVDKPVAVGTPVASPAAKKPAVAQPAAEAPVAEAAATVEEKPAAAAVDPASMSVAEMLAAARGESAAPAAAAEEPAVHDPAVEEKPAAAAVDPANMSVAEMLAAARGESAAPAAAAEEPATEEPAAEEPAADNDDGGEVQALKEADDAAGMCAYCRKIDA